MNEEETETNVTFGCWRPMQGRVFDREFAFDTETTLIDDARPWLTPAYVLGAGYDGEHGYFVERQHVRQFMMAHGDVAIIMHNAPFDLDVLHTLVPDIDVYRWVEDDLVWDTQLLHRLLVLGTDGHTARGRGQSTLDHCAECYLGMTLSKDLQDTKGKPVRTSYGQWLNRPIVEIEPVYLEYLAKDSVVTYFVYRQLRTRLAAFAHIDRDTWGYVSPDWYEHQTQTWGPQTHHIQLKAAVALRGITTNGLNVDHGSRAGLEAQLSAALDEKLAELRSHGYVPGQKGSGKALQEILRNLEACNPGLNFPRTPSGKYATDKETLTDLMNEAPFLRSLVEHREVSKLLSTYVGKMAKPSLHPSFGVLTDTGRTSSFGDLNAQNLPRDDRIRSCFVPAPGRVFVDADYSTVEMATLAQSTMSQLGISSNMADAINRGEDLHRLVAARFMKKPESEVTKDERQKAKAINFGKPGGMGSGGLKDYAKAGYGVELEDDEVEELSDSWFDLFPEMKEFLKHDSVWGLSVAELLNLTPTTYYEHTGIQSFLDYGGGGSPADEPHPILGGMCLKTFLQEAPETGAGRPYSPEELDFFWSQLEKQIDHFPKTHHAAIHGRRPSAKLRGAVLHATDKASVFTHTGRLRANASYCQRHNTMFQGLAADGAKLGLWLVWRAGYSVVNFIHDELLVEVPAGPRLRLHSEIIRHLMIKGMQMVVPDVHIDVEYAVTDRWYKSGGVLLDDKGRLTAWRKQLEALAC